jgi:hypothetical protein
MAPAIGFFVQFPHPGGEHKPPGDTMPWNIGDHRRKFLVAPGSFVNSERHLREAQLVFWGEWEPPSRMERRWPAYGRLPRCLHRPYWTEPATRGYRQNTDPWVFGERMIYSNCRQTTGPGRRATSMQRLTRGSVICFGSTIDGEFCVDTVFVVASAEPWVPAEVAELDVDDAFKTCTGCSITTAGRDAHLSLTLYRGATLDEPVDGMFSFVPARLADADDPRFRRPVIQLPESIDPSIRRSTWGSKRRQALETLRDRWEEVRRQVLAADLLLAVRLQTPDRETRPAPVPETVRQRC